MVKRVQAALVAKFWGFTSGVGKYDLSNDKAEESGQEQQYIVMGLCIKTTHSEDLLVIIDSTLSKDWPHRRSDLAMAMLDNDACL